MEAFHIKLSKWLTIITALFQIHGYVGCLEKERTALLEVKAFFKSINRTEYADANDDDRTSDCCAWKRVRCNATTRRVIELHFSRIPFIRDSLYEYPLLNFSSFAPFKEDKYPLLNLSLFAPFEELQTLNLSFNNLGGFYMSNGNSSYNFGSLKQLEIIDLAYNHLNDSILLYLSSLISLKTLILQGNNMVEVFKSKQARLGNLTKLEILDLTFNGIDSSLGSQGLCELKNLVQIDLNFNYINGHLPYCLNNLTNLKVLDLSYNQLSGNLLPSTIPTSIEYLSLAKNNFEGLFLFSSLANLSELQVFQLSGSQLRIDNEEFFWLPKYQLKALVLNNCSLHAIPNFLLNQSDLRYIDLSENMLFGNFPTWLLQNNTKLEVLYLRNNSLSGVLQLPISRHGLLHLDVSNNCFTGPLHLNIGKLPILQDLIVSKNNFEGGIPSSMGEMKSLRTLDMSSNNFSGELSRELVTGCISLSYLSLSHNNFQGEVFPKYMNLTELRELHLDNNHFSGKIQDGLSKATTLYILDISNNKLSGEIPHWIENLSSLEVFSMSNNLLEGNIPVQLSNLKELRILDISKNRLSGSKGSSLNFSSLQHLYMHKNAFNGSIPNALRRSSNLVTLDLRDNQFSGNIPHWIDELLRLRILLLRGNRLRGYISNRLCQLHKLSILDLSYNMFNGSIPPCFTNLTLWMQLGSSDIGFQLTHKVLHAINYFDTINSLNSSFNVYLFKEVDRPSGQRGVEFMTKNRYEAYEGNILNYMTGLDLSRNELTGDIPLEIGNLQQIHALNLSHNYLSGSIPTTFSKLKMIESLDLSSNKLSGRIPPQLIELYSLAIFNVSYNNLSGPTPNTWQFANFDESNYAGNPYLCGPTIKKSCSNMAVETMTSSSGSKEDELTIDMVAFYWSFVASCVTFILGLFMILWSNSYWRRLWFRFIDECIDSCFYRTFLYV